MLNYLQRLILILPFNASHADSFTSCMTPVETSTTPYWITATHRWIFILALKNGIVNEGKGFVRIWIENMCISR